MKFDPDMARRREERLYDIMRRDPQRYDYARRCRYDRIYEALLERQGLCPQCGGDGTIEAKHPQWGSRTCPEAWIAVRCDECGGTGECDIPEVDGHIL